MWVSTVLLFFKQVILRGNNVIIFILLTVSYLRVQYSLNTKLPAFPNLRP